MKERSAIYKRPNPRTIFVGIRQDIPPRTQELERFIAELKGTKHIIAEGSFNDFEHNAKDPRSYTRAVLQYSNAVIYFPEETSDLIKIMHNYGIEQDLIGTYFTFPILIDIISDTPGHPTGEDHRIAMNVLKNHLRDLSKKFPGFKQIDRDYTLKRIDQACSYIARRFKDQTGTRILPEFAQDIQGYINMLKQYEIFMPQIREIPSTDKKIIMVGQEQVDNLVSFMKNESEAPKLWSKFKQTLSFGSKTIVEIIEEGKITSVIEGGQK